MLDKNGNSITPKEELWNWVDDLFNWIGWAILLGATCAVLWEIVGGSCR